MSSAEADGEAAAASVDGLSPTVAEFMATGPIGLLTVAADGVVAHANEAAIEILERDLAGHGFFDFVHPDDIARIISASLTNTAGTLKRRGRGSLWRMMLPRGDSVEILAHMAMVELDGIPFGQIGFLPAPPRLAVLQTLELIAAGRPLGETFAALIDGIASDESGIAVNWVDADGTVHVFGNLEPVLAGVDGLGQRDQGTGTPWAEAISQMAVARRASLDDLRPEVADAARAAGYEGCCVTPLKDPATGLALLYINWVRHPSHLDYVQQTFADVLADVVQVALDRAEDTRLLTHAAHHDQLTNLANRRAFFQQLAVAIHADAASVLYLDLDRFKPINDRLGHDAGDRVLAAVANRLLAAAPDGALVARLGGDEFAIVLAGDDGRAAEQLAADLVRSIPRPIDLDDHGPVSVSVSIGWAVTDPAPTDDGRGLMAAADEALRDAKRSGKGAWVRADVRRE
jgi:diguanylate cyclase (GGDEF)-like protein